jgi:hypothetical protein
MEFFIMTDVSFHVPSLPFPSLERQQQAQAGGLSCQQGDGQCAAPKGTIQNNETFIPRGLSAADLATLFPKVQL